MTDFDSVYDRNAARVYRLCLVRLGRREDAEDALQNVFMRWLRLMPDFESAEHEKAYFLRAAHNECVNIKRSLIRHNRVEFDDLPEQLISYTDDTERFEVGEILRLIAPKYRELLCMFYYEDMTSAEIAKILGRNESTVRTQLQKAREAVRKILKEEDNNDEKE